MKYEICVLYVICHTHYCLQHALHKISIHILIEGSVYEVKRVDQLHIYPTTYLVYAASSQLSSRPALESTGTCCAVGRRLLRL